MIKQTGKRILALFMVLTVFMSALSVPTFAADHHNAFGLLDTGSYFDVNNDNPLWNAFLKMNAVLIRYLGAGSYTERDIADVALGMDNETAQYAKDDIESLDPMINRLGNTDKKKLLGTKTAKALDVFYSYLDGSVSNLSTSPQSNVTVLGGKVLITDSADTASVSGNTVTITVKGGMLTSKVNTIDIYNNTDKISTLSFDYNASNYESFSEGSSSGKYSVLLYPDGNVTLSLKSKTGYQEAKLVLSNISLVEAAEESNVTFNYDSSYGSISVDGEKVSSGSSRVITLSKGATLTATEANGGKFLGWINPETNFVYSTSTTYKITPVNDMTVKAVFAGANSEAYFTAGNNSYLFNNLNNAVAYASSTGRNTVVLANDGKLPAGNYTIPSGITLLIPFDANNTVYTTTPEVESETRIKPTAYRTLTMAPGANIIVNGALSIPAKHFTAKGGKTDGGSPNGPCGFIKMENGSNITVNNGGNLYAYGFIIGSGSVVAKSGANVYEYFQIMDFRGGTQTTDMENGVFPLSQYYIQNIEVPLTLEAGSVESSYTSVYISSMEFGSAVSFIAKKDAMFNLTSGSVTKYYDPATDRLVVEVNGEISISPIELKFGSGLLAKTINSKDYVLPINNNITVKVNSGTITLAQNISMLPGAEIIIGKDARCVLGSGTNVYIYDSSEWGNFCGATNKTFIPLQYAPGRKYSRTDADLKDARIQVDGVLDASAGYIYTTASGADISSSDSGVVLLKKGSQTKTHQLVQKSGYTEIPITPAKLKNADGKYMQPSGANSSNYYINGVWTEHTNHIYTLVESVQPDCENSGYNKYTCPCGYGYTETVSATGHSLSGDATCTQSQTCTVCGKVLEEAKGHSYSVVITYPTCTEGGYTTSTCLRCGEVLVTDEVSALGHTAGAAATCEDAQTCTVCGDVLEEAKGHNYSDEIFEPDCTNAGYTKHTCLNCGDSYTDSEKPALGHTPGAQATCTQPQTCVVCGEVLASENGHTPGEKPTCTQPQICLVCGDELLPALGHNMVHSNAIEPTCTEDGYSSGSHCVLCGYEEGNQIIPAKGHTPNGDVTCTATQVCTECNEVIAVAKGHSYRITVTLPTCVNIGYTTHTCTECGNSYTDSEVPETGHTAGAEATCKSAQTCTVCDLELAPVKPHTPGENATCTQAQTCTECNEVIAQAKGHTPGTRATCTKGQSCTECGQELTASLGHRFTTATTNATCTENGSTVNTCSRCRYQYIANEVSATGHNMSDATCTEPSTCLNCCGYTEGKALGHTEVIDAAIPVTCTQNGITQGSHCGVCGEVIIAQQVVETQGHILTYYEAKAPTYTSVGWEAYEKCSRCDHTTYVEIPVLENPNIDDYDTFIINLAALEEIANMYAAEFPGKDPVELVIKYIRTGVDKYTEGSWGIMAGYEDADFAAYVARFEEDYNAMAGPDAALRVTALKDLENFVLPNGDTVDFGHMFGTMDITYHNKTSLNHADVAGWAGDLVDLMEFSDYGGVSGTLDEMIEEIGKNYLLQDDPEEVGGFNEQDMFGDLDALYLMDVIIDSEYKEGLITEIFTGYFTENLTMESRADYFLKNRLGGISIRADVRDAVYNAYTGNRVITTLEATKVFNTKDLSVLRRACCYAFADYVCELAGDYVENTENPYFTVFESETSTLAPGIIQTSKKATTADNKQMVYYTATADLSRDDIFVYANYKDNDPTSWGMQTVLEQSNAAQNKYGNPESDLYVENYNVIVGINGGGYNMETGEPGGLLIMDGTEYHGIGSTGFFGITKDGKAVIGTTQDYNKYYKDELKEAIGGFGSMLVKDGKVLITSNTDYATNRASRTAVGITQTGKVVFMVLDGRQEPVSCGGTYNEIAHIMLEAGCVQAINLDGGGSTTLVTRKEGDDKLSVSNKPSDGAARSVSTSLIMVSTAPSSTAFDHAIIESEYDFMTKNSSVQLTAKGVSATGNTAELPEGTSWAVSDDKWATVTEDGVLTALRNGSVDVYLMLGDTVIGTKTINIVVPDRVYFSKTNMNAIYGQKAELPVMALYENKPVKAIPEDLVFTLSTPSAGVVEGFGFIGNEASGVKNVIVTASLAADSTESDSISVALYTMDEVSFDFDNATGGDRTMAWNRVVSNSTTEDEYVYEIVDYSEEMITEYTFGIDMTQIPIPEQLADLTTMLPGAELENASAWSFLMQLAERVSVLTEVKATVRIDSNFEVDYSNISLVNDYFVLTNTEFDEATNTLTLTLNWKDQTQAIDPDMANPLCILKGIKLIPKQGVDWPNDRLTVVNAGDISYKMYMRANALYTFAQNTQNQEAYGILPFVNPDNPNEKGGYFGATYAYFEDTYILSKAVKEGWVNEENGFAYYVDGQKYTGICLIDGYYYDFGENGINIGQTKFTGLFYDEANGVYRYSKLGELMSGWHMINDEWYYFHSSTLAAKGGYYRVGEVYFNFEETGKVSDGVWIKTLEGTRYYYGPSYYFRGWYEIDGNLYYFRGGYRYEGLRSVSASAMPTTWYDFGDDGVCRGVLNGIYYLDGYYRYIENGIATEKHLFKYGDDYYYATYGGKLATNTTLTTASTNCDLPKGTYTFDAEGKMIGSSANGEIVELDGVLYYYEKGVGVEKGLVKVGNDYYYAAYKGKLVTNKELKIPMTSCDLPIDRYEFGADGKMLDGIVEKDGVLYYYETGKGVEKGLIKVDGAYYYAAYKGKLAVNTSLRPSIINCDLPKATYEFGADGKALDGIIEKDGELYYYENGVADEKGLIKIGDDYYYAAYKGKLVVGKSIKATVTSCDLPAGEHYEFDAEGKMISGIIEKDGILYYYENGKGVEKGLIKIGNDYYYAAYNGKLAVNTSLRPSIINCDLPKATYEFGADGKALNGIVEKDGVLYYYENGIGVEKGLVKVGEDYYYAAYKGKIAVSKTLKVTLTNCDLPAGVKYEFDANGKMLNGIIEKDGELYYYENGQALEKGLTKIGDDYYYVAYKGKIAVNKTIKVTLSSCDLPTGVKYEFGPDGKMLNGIVEKDGELYYYENGLGVEKGLVYVDGYYYYATYKGKLAVNTTIKITATNNLLIADTYTFNEKGQIIG